MSFEQIMLNNRTYQYFRIYSTLCALHPDTYSIHDIAQRVDLPYPKAYNLTQGLANELALIDPNAAALIADNGSLDTTQLTIDLDTFRYHLLTTQVPYQILYYLLTDDEPSIADFCKQYEASQATVFRKIKPLNALLHKFGLRFTFSQMNIVGDERKVILFLFCIFRLATRGVVWPFTEQDQVIATEAHQQFITRLQIPSDWENTAIPLLFLAIINLRMHHGNYVEANSRGNILLVDNDNYESHLLNTKLIESQNYPKWTEAHKQAVLQFGYQLLNIVPTFRKEDAYLKATLDYFYTRHNIVWQFATEFLNHMQQNSFKLPQRLVTDKILLGNVINVILTGYLFDGVVPSLTLIADTEQPLLTGGYDYADLYHEISAYFAHLPEKYIQLFGDHTQITQALYQLLLPVYAKYKKEYHLRVALMVPGDSAIYQRYADFYHNSFAYIDIEPYDQKDAANYDLIFTSSIAFYLAATKHKQQPVVYFHQGSPESELAPLLRARDYYLKKFPTLPQAGTLY